MPVAEMAVWEEYASIEPFGSHYDDLRAGGITAAIYNVNRDPKKAPQPFSPLDFTPWNALAKKADEPILHADPEQQSRALAMALFGDASPWRNR